MPKFLIVDTSLVAKWFLNEPDSEKSELVLDSISQGQWQIVAPALMRCELTHVFWKNRRQGYGAERVSQALEELEKLGLQEVPLNSLFPDAVQISFSYAITIYDSLYVTLAEKLHGVLATFDKDLIKQVKSHSALQFLEI